MRLISCFLTAIIFLNLACSAPHEVSTSATGSTSYVAPGYTKKKYNKIMVMALLPDNSYRKRAENSLVSELKARGFKVVPSTEIFTNEMLKDTAALRSTAEAAGVDAAITLQFLGAVSNISDQGKFNGSMYSFFGTPYAVVDMETFNVRTGMVQIDLFTADKLGTQYRTGLPFKISNGPDAAFQEFSIQARRRLINDRVL
jgi:hypothetical protein